MACSMILSTPTALDSPNWPMTRDSSGRVIQFGAKAESTPFIYRFFIPHIPSLVIFLGRAKDALKSVQRTDPDLFFRAGMLRIQIYISLDLSRSISTDR